MTIDDIKFFPDHECDRECRKRFQSLRQTPGVTHRDLHGVRSGVTTMEHVNTIVDEWGMPEHMRAHLARFHEVSQ